MFVVLLKMTERKDQAPPLMAGHMQWLQNGFDEGVFLLSGSLQAQAGGAIVAHGTTLEDLQARVQDDPFVVEGVVHAEILPIRASKADERLAFLLS
jgi:uncharacterized protein YciI